MKNKDGIILEVGQVWTNVANEKEEVIGYHGGNVVLFAYVTARFFSIEACDKNHFNTLVKYHDGADLEQARKSGWKIWVD